MKVYLVGTPVAVDTIQEHFLLGKLAGKPVQRIFTQNEIQANINNTENLRLFKSLDDAREFSRSLRICQASHVFNPSRKKFAPVVEVELSDSINDEITVAIQQTEEVTVKEYQSMYHNFSHTSHTSTVNFFVIESLNNPYFHWVEFPDTNYARTQFDARSADQDAERVSSPCLLL